MTDFCRHYPSGGMADNTHCEAGVDMRSVCDLSTRPLHAPCYTPDAAHLCAKHEAYTAEEVAEQRREAAEAIRAMNALSASTSTVCPYCGATVEALDQVERCVYSRPCGCRQFQGTVPDAWK